MMTKIWGKRQKIRKFQKYGKNLQPTKFFEDPCDYVVISCTLCYPITVADGIRVAVITHTGLFGHNIKIMFN